MLALSSFEFKAMGSPCELRIYARNAELAATVIYEAVREINRLEDKYSRYKDNNFFHKVNLAAKLGSSIEVDDEFVSLLEYADTCYQQSDGLFDPTSGVLRKAWSFDGSALPDKNLLTELLQSVGWQHLSWKNNLLNFAKPGMEIDFGGIVKEYASDSAAVICEQKGVNHGIVNLAGDINVIGPHPNNEPWLVQIQHPRIKDKKMASFKITRGALASSGDYERFVEIDGDRYSHILSPKTGWPVKGLAAVSVMAERCVIAGSACTIAMLKEKQGCQWLEELGCPHVWMDTEQYPGGTSSKEDSRVIWHLPYST